MLKGLEARVVQSAAKLQAKTPAPVLRSVLVSASYHVRRKHLHFKPASRGFLRTVAAQAGQAIPTKLPLTAVTPNSVYEGTVTKVEAYGAFVDFGAEAVGLVHVSQFKDGFEKSATEHIKVGDAVKVRVLSVDPALKRTALSLRGLDGSSGSPSATGTPASGTSDASQTAPGTVAAADPSPALLASGSDRGDNAFDYSILERDDVFKRPRPGYTYVFSDELGDDFPFEMEEGAELTQEDLMALEFGELEIQSQTDLPVPLQEEISGTVTAVSADMLTVEFKYNDQTFTGTLQKEELKVPVSALSAEQLQSVKAGLPTGKNLQPYIDLQEVSDASQYYKIGDLLPAFVLDCHPPDSIKLTMFTYMEVEAQAFQLAAAGEDIDVPALGMFDEQPSLLAQDPLQLLEEDSESISGRDDDDGAVTADDNKLVAEYVRHRRQTSGLHFKQIPSVNLPSRPVASNPSFKVYNCPTKFTDFEGDTVTLDDVWEVPSPRKLPKRFLKRLGYKIVYNEEGEGEVQERADKKDLTPEQLDKLLTGASNEGIPAWVKELLDGADEDEDELPPLAMRRPLVLAAAAGISASAVKELRDKTGAGMMDCKKALTECSGDAEKAVEWLRKKGLSGADKKASRVAAEGAISKYIHPGSRLGVLLEVNCETDFVAASEKFRALVDELGMIIAATPEVVVVRPEDVPAKLLEKERAVEMGREDLKSKPEAIRAKIVEGRLAKARDSMALMNQASLREPSKTVAEAVKETIAAVGENIQIRRFVKYQLGEGLEKKKADFAAEVAQQTQTKAQTKAQAAPAATASAQAPAPGEKKEEKKAAVAVSPSLVKELREKTGAGMMDCKRALSECANDLDVATEWLRKKGLSGADKKAGRLAAEGAVAAYIHPGSRLGVLLEVNCETDFVAKSERFLQLVEGVAMQIAASPSVQYVSKEDIPPEVLEREKQVEMQREDLKSKPEAIRAKIAAGRASKIVAEMALLDQPYLMEPSKTVGEAVKEAIAAIGEKISVRRFTKFQLGEGLEKKNNDFAAEVAAITGSK